MVPFFPLTKNREGFQKARDLGYAYDYMLNEETEAEAQDASAFENNDGSGVDNLQTFFDFFNKSYFSRSNQTLFPATIIPKSLDVSQNIKFLLNKRQMYSKRRQEHYKQQDHWRSIRLREGEENFRKIINFNPTLSISMNEENIGNKATFF